MQNWVHQGFSVFQGVRIDPDEHEARQRLAGYMVHPPISLERMRYRPETGQVIYCGQVSGASGTMEMIASEPNGLTFKDPDMGMTATQSWMARITHAPARCFRRASPSP